MSFFKPPDNPVSVEVAPFTFMVSRVTPPATDGAPPTWQPFGPETRLKLLGIFYGSSIGGPSYARLRAVTGAPVSDQIDPERVGILLPGDRVIISQNKQPLFGGYMVQGELGIEDDAETLQYRLAGPEWAWGAGGRGSGSFQAIRGQRRRNAKADEDWTADDSAVAGVGDQINVTAERCTFNAGGRRNMTTADVQLGGASGALGRIFESPDRKVNGTLAADWWTVNRAAKLLVELINNPDLTGIQAITDWAAVDAILGAAKSMRDVQVDGLGLWDALAKVLGPEFFFYVDPRPQKVDTWGNFRVRFAGRTDDIDGTEADFWLDARGTSVADGKPCVRRLQAVKTIERTVNQVTVLGRAVRHVRLVYWGKETGNKKDAGKQLALQHGWNPGLADLHDYAKSGKVNIATAQDTDEKYKNWRDRHVVRGKDFDAYKAAFRLFTWNEANELQGAAPKYGNGYTGVEVAWYAPDLSGIADGAGLFDPAKGLGEYCRRRRPVLDTQYLDGQLDQWRRVKPKLWIAAVPETGEQTEPTPDKFVSVPNDKWALDPERAAVWITEPDLLLWTPLMSEPTADSGDTTVVPDDRSFASLLYSGRLRMILEGSVETDWALEGAAPRTDDSGSPVVREALVRADDVYAYSAEGPSAIGSPVADSLAGTPVDQREDAQSYAEQLRAGGQDEQVHSSLLATGTWGVQGIGKMIYAIYGRYINLSSTSGRGAQIVAAHLDPDALAMEYLTESAAMELRKDDRVKLAAKRRTHRGGPLDGKGKRR